MHAKRMERHHKRLKNKSKLNLVSLMDIFTILVFFLLVNSSDVEVLQNNKSIKLPESIAEKKPDETLVVMVDAENIIVGGRKVANVPETNASSELTIAGLKQELDYQAKRKPYRNEEQAKLGRNISIMADKDTPYNLLKKIMSTSAKSEFRNISLAVSQVPDESTPLEAVDESATGGL
jgi:biopolymer transport protein ExbD